MHILGVKAPLDFASSNRGKMHHFLGIAPSLSEREISTRKTRWVNFRPWSTIDVHHIIQKSCCCASFSCPQIATSFKMKVSTEKLLCDNLAVLGKMLRFRFDKAWTDGSKNTDSKYQLVLTQRQDFEINHFEGKKSLMTTLQIKPCEPQNETGCIEDTTGFCEREYCLLTRQKNISPFLASFFLRFKLELLCYFTLKLCGLLNFCVLYSRWHFRIIARLFKTQSALRNVKRYFSTPLVFGLCLPSKSACKRKVCQKILTRWSRSAHFMRVLSCPQCEESSLPFEMTKSEFSKHFWTSNVKNFTSNSHFPDQRDFEF